MFIIIKKKILDITFDFEVLNSPPSIIHVACRTCRSTCLSCFVCLWLFPKSCQYQTEYCTIYCFQQASCLGLNPHFRERFACSGELPGLSAAHIIRDWSVQCLSHNSLIFTPPNCCNMMVMSSHCSPSVSDLNLFSVERDINLLQFFTHQNNMQ